MRLLPWTVVLTLFSLVVLGVVLWFRHNRVVTLPALTGPYAVGRVSYDWVDESRAETRCDTVGDNRELPVWIWYPVAPNHPAAEPVAYLPTAWRVAREALEGLGSALLLQNLANVHAHALADVALARDRPTYPLLIFQPGLGPIATDYTAILEDLASHGYIVIASTPTCSASVVVFGDGRVQPGTAAGNVDDKRTFTETKAELGQLLQIWAADNEFVLTQAAALNRADPRHLFTGRLDLQRVGFFGHSFGGASAIQVCSQEPRCKAGADLDGYPYGDVDHLIVPQPFLFVWSEATDPTGESARYAVAATRTIVAHAPQDKLQLTLRGTRHFNFSDMALYYNPIYRLMGLLGSIDGQRGIAITRAYLTTFFDHYLQGAAAPVLTNPAREYPEVQSVPAQ